MGGGGGGGGGPRMMQPMPPPQIIGGGGGGMIGGGPLPPPSLNGGHHGRGGGMGRPLLPDNASPTLYIEGVPKDATVREICHIFRPFEGFQSARLVQKEGRGPLCFAEYASPELAFGAKEVLQGYLMDRDDPNSRSLHIVFAKTERQERGGGGGKHGRGGESMPYGREPGGSRGAGERGGGRGRGGGGGGRGGAAGGGGERN